MAEEETARCPDDSIVLCCDDLLHVIPVLLFECHLFFKIAISRTPSPKRKLLNLMPGCRYSLIAYRNDNHTDDVVVSGAA